MFIGFLYLKPETWNLKLKIPVLTKVGAGIFLLRHLSRRYRYIHLRSGSVLTALDRV